MTTGREFHSITVGDLIEALKAFDEDALVTFSSNYGDYSKTQQVHSLTGDVEELPLEESAYSASGFALHEAEDDEADEIDEEEMNDAQTAVVIMTHERKWL